MEKLGALRYFGLPFGGGVDSAGGEPSADEGVESGWLRGEDWPRILTEPWSRRNSSMLDFDPEGETAPGGWRTAFAACSISPPNLKVWLV